MQEDALARSRAACRAGSSGLADLDGLCSGRSGTAGVDDHGGFLLDGDRLVELYVERSSVDLYLGGVLNDLVDRDVVVVAVDFEFIFFHIR